MNHDKKKAEYNHLLSKAINLQNAAQFSQALSIYLDLVELAPNNSRTLFLLGGLYGQTGDFSNCIKILKRSLAISPEQKDAYNNLAIAYELTQQFDLAITTYKIALGQAANSPHTHCNLGDLYRKTGQFEKSLFHLNKSLALSPTDATALLNKAILLGEMKKTHEAKACYGEALNLYPNNEAILNNYSALLLKEGDLDNAEQLARKAITINPSSPQALCNLGNLLTKKKQFSESETCLLKAIELSPTLVDAYINLGYSHHCNAKFKNALRYYNMAIQLAPKNSLGHWYRSFTLLLTGKFDSAWNDYEYGILNGERDTTQYPYPAYQNSNQTGALLITAEQGIGDQIMFSSCLPDIIKKHDEIILECDKRLIPLFERSFPSIQIIYTSQLNNTSIKERLPTIQHQIAIGSLPRLYRRSAESFPSVINHIIINNEKQKKWHQRYNSLSDKIKIGISWKGGIKIDNKSRSMPLELWADILKLDADFINLQYGDNSQEIAEIKNKLGIQIHDWPDSDSLKEIDDFAAQISALDLVISVGNTNVHLAGSLNIPTWCILPSVPSWRWLFKGEQCLWYPSVSIIRKNTSNWENVFSRIELLLKNRLQKKNPKQ